MQYHTTLKKKSKRGAGGTGEKRLAIPHYVEEKEQERGRRYRGKRLAIPHYVEEKEQERGRRYRGKRQNKRERKGIDNNIYGTKEEIHKTAIATTSTTNENCPSQFDTKSRKK